MARVLIVPKGERRSAQQAHHRSLSASGVTLFALDIPTRNLEPRDELGKLYGAEVCVVGLRADIVAHLVETYQVRADPRDVLTGTVAQNHAALLLWIRKDAPAAPVPTFAEIAEEARGGNRRLVFAERAFDHANEVSSSVRDGADGFPDFLRESVVALAKLAELDSLTGGDLSDYFRREAPLATYASSGQESIEYTDPFRLGQVCTSQLHLKPAKERRGYHDRSIKPRLHFDVLTDKSRANADRGGAGSSAKYVLILYFGPHLPSRTTLVVSVRIVPLEPNNTE